MYGLHTFPNVIKYGGPIIYYTAQIHSDVPPYERCRCHGGRGGRQSGGDSPSPVSTGEVAPRVKGRWGGSSGPCCDLWEGWDVGKHGAAAPWGAVNTQKKLQEHN